MLGFRKSVAPLQMRSLALGVGILLLIALAIAAVPICFILILNANDAAAQNEEVARHQPACRRARYVPQFVFYICQDSVVRRLRISRLLLVSAEK